jgi:hypothetical protein
MISAIVLKDFSKVVALGCNKLALQIVGFFSFKYVFGMMMSLVSFNLSELLQAWALMLVVARFICFFLTPKFSVT